MKFVGIDFGHGEVSASYFDGNTLQQLKLVPTASTNVENFKIPSYLYRCQEEDGSFLYDIVEKAPCTLISEMKKPIDKMREEEKINYGIFIRLIYQRLLEYNGEIIGNEDDFELAIACPTKWGDNQKAEYKEFFQNVLGRSIYAIMNESDAAYFSKWTGTQQGATSETSIPILVVDYGSSTIDFTFVKDGEKQDIDACSSANLGASMIENAILCKYEKEGNYTQIKNSSAPILRQFGRDWIDYDAFIKANIRKLKEEMFTGGKETFPGKIYQSVKALADREELKGYIYEYALEEKVLRIEEIKIYINAVKQHFARVHQATGNVDKIILSGGASCMPWVQQALQEEFCPSLGVIRDDAPSFVVCDGIVKYCFERQNCLEEFLEEVKKIDVKKILKECDMQAINELRKPLLTKIIDDFASSNNQRTTLNNLVEDILEGCFRVFNTKNKTYADKLNDTIKEYTAQSIFRFLDYIIFQKFRVHVNANTYKMATKNYPVENLMTGLNYQNFDFLRDRIKHVVDKWWYTFSKCIFFTNFDKPLNQLEREEVAKKLKNDESTELFLGIEKEITIDFEKTDVKPLMGGIESLARYLFDKMELFKTRFAAQSA